MRSKNERNNKKKSKNRATKIHLVFDEKKRREFLTGFHKRKLQRKKEAKEKFDKELKEERKRIKNEAKESYKKMILSHKPIPELENLLSEEYEDGDVSVKVVELSTDAIAKKCNWIGANRPIVKDEEEAEAEAEDEQSDVEECPGMELHEKKNATKPNTKESKLEFKSEKDVKKALKKKATKTVKKSKIFQKKNRLEQQKQRKQSMKMKSERFKLRDKKSYHGQNKKFKSKRSNKT